MSDITENGEWYLIAGKKGESINKTVLNLSNYQFDAELGIVSLGNTGSGNKNQTYTCIDAKDVILKAAIQNNDDTEKFEISDWGKINNLDEELGESVGVWVLTKSPPSTYTFINFGYSEDSNGSLFSGELLPSVSDTFKTTSWNVVKNAVTPTKPDGSYIDTFGRLSFLVGSNNINGDKDLYMFQKEDSTKPIELKINNDNNNGLECVDFYYNENDSTQNYLLVCTLGGLFYKLDDFSDLNNLSSKSLSTLSANMDKILANEKIYDITWINKSQTYQPRWYFACSNGVWYCDDLKEGEIESLNLPSDWNNAIVYGISSTISLNNDKPRTTPLAVFSNDKANFTLDENGNSWAGLGVIDPQNNNAFTNARKGVLIELNNNVVQIYISSVKSVQGTIDRAKNSGSVDTIKYGDNLNIRSEALTYLPTSQGGNGQLAFGTGSDVNYDPQGVIYMTTKNGVIGDVSNFKSIGTTQIDKRITALSLI